MSNEKISKEQRDDLRKAALAASKGEWRVDAPSDKTHFYSSVISDFASDNIATTGMYSKRKADARQKALANKNANYIAKAQPQVILALLDMIDRLEVEAPVGREREGWCEE